MEITEDSLDGLLVGLYSALIADGARNEGSRGSTIELLGVTLRLTKPRARLSRSEDRGKPFSALGELLWYLSGSDRLDFIEPYVPRYKEDAEEGIIHGAYGPRLFAMRGKSNQIDNVIALLKKSPGSRRAVIQLFNAEDIERRYLEIPCTTTLQFLSREGRLHLSVTMRSNDAYFGLPHDVFCFTMIQEMVARTLRLELGDYYHYVGSMHLYETHIEKAAKYNEEGHQRTIEMPVMPNGDPFGHVPLLLSAEDRFRHGEPVNIAVEAPDQYWADILRLYNAFWASGDAGILDTLVGDVSSTIYRNYVDGRRSMPRKTLRTRGTE